MWYLYNRWCTPTPFEDRASGRNYAKTKQKLQKLCKKPSVTTSYLRCVMFVYCSHQGPSPRTPWPGWSAGKPPSASVGEGWAWDYSRPRCPVSHGEGVPQSESQKVKWNRKRQALNQRKQNLHPSTTQLLCHKELCTTRSQYSYRT